MSKIASLAVVLSFRIFGLLTHDLYHSQRRLRKASRLSGLPLPPNALYISRNGTTGAGVVAAEAEVVVAVAAVVAVLLAASRAGVAAAALGIVLWLWLRPEALLLRYGLSKLINSKSC